MDGVTILHGAKSVKILLACSEEKTPAIMSYLSRDKQHVVKVLLNRLRADRLDIQILLTPGKKPRPLNIQSGQEVSVSLKYGYGKFIFDTTVVAPEAPVTPTSGATIVLTVPNIIELVQRRSYFRVNVPQVFKVNVLLWHCRAGDNHQVPPKHYWHGRLIDISAGGAQIVIPRGQLVMKKYNLKKGQFVVITFTPIPYETPLIFDARIRSILPTADNKSICLGLQIVGLEARPKGRQVLHRLVGIVERYHQINQGGAKRQDIQPG